MYDAESVGLSVVGGNLCQKLAVADARRGCEAGFGLDERLDLLGAVDTKGVSPLVVGDIKEGLVEREGFDEVGVVLEYLSDVPSWISLTVEPFSAWISSPMIPMDMVPSFDPDRFDIFPGIQSLIQLRR